MHNCQYCEEFERGKIQIEGRDICRNSLFQSENFIVFPSLGQIVEGYLLIATKKHYIALGAIPAELYPELEYVQKQVGRVLLDNYSNPFFLSTGLHQAIKKVVVASNMPIFMLFLFKQIF